MFIDGVDSTQEIKKTGCYLQFYIGYYTDKDIHNQTLHLYEYGTKVDFGELNVEKYNYRQLDICGANLNHLSWDTSQIYAPQKNYCNTSLSNNCVTWDIISLTSNELIIEANKFSKKYYCKYSKI
ncbi:MAG: hypothetical protein RJA07_2239 [Bacteroidota bacterium]|jgi:hypothetical protein